MNGEAEKLTVTGHQDLGFNNMDIIEKLKTKQDHVEEVNDNQLNLKELCDEEIGRADDEHSGRTKGNCVKRGISLTESVETAVSVPCKNCRKKKRHQKGEGHFVQKILAKQVNAKGEVVYWMNSLNANTCASIKWEPKENLPQFLVEEFEESLAKQGMPKTPEELELLLQAQEAEDAKRNGLLMLKPTQEEDGGPIDPNDTNIDEKRVKNIHGLVQTKLFLVEFEDGSAFLVPTEVLQRTHPEDVIQFNKNKLYWE